jgi:signal transduction histidine kinase
MSRLSDEELIDQLRERFEENRKALHDLRAVSDTLGVMNRKLKESEALKSNFLANIRNEINNPLTAILGLAKVLADRLDGEGETAVVAGMIYSEAFDFYFQLRNILIAASLEAGESLPFYTRTDMSRLVRMTMDSFSHLTLKKGVKVVLTSGEPSAQKLGSLRSDAEKVQIILANLLANAIEFSPGEGVVDVGLSCTQGELRLTVQDYGAGIPPEKRRDIFDRFQQLDTGVSKAHRGHGIGLSITRELVDILGGTIAVSGDEGGGTLFTVILPLPAGEHEGTVYADSGNAFIFDAGPDDDDQFTESV